MDKKKKLIISVGVILVILICIGFTLTYFRSNFTSSKKIATDIFRATYTSTLDTPSEWVPGSSTTGNFKVKNESNMSVAVRAKIEEQWYDSAGNTIDNQVDNQDVATKLIDSGWGLYDGWYYVGIGKNLHDLPLIAEKSGREDYLLRIEDLDQLEFMLDDWISKIPESQPIEQGEVLFNNFKLKSYKLKSGKNSKVISSAEDLTFDILNTYKRTPVNVEFKAAKATFQSDDRSSTIQIKLTPETGIIQVSPMHTKTTTCGFNPNSEIKGKGILKIHFVANINGLDKQFDEAFDIDGKTASELLFEKIFWPLIIALILILIIVAFIIIKKFLPVKITMEVIGNRSEKPRAVAMKMKKRVEFGSKPGLAFKLDSEMFSPIVGQIQRLSANKWQIIPRDESAFEDGNKKFDYVLGSILKLKTKDESTISIKFRKAKK